MKRFLGIMTAAILLCSVLTGCGSKASSTSPSAYNTLPEASHAPASGANIPVFEAPPYSEPNASAGSGVFAGEEYDSLKENGFTSVAVSPVSTFSADVETASYCNVRRMLRDGYGIGDIPAGAVRTEEMLNYFTYDYASPGKGEPFGLTACISACPWNG